MSVAMWNCTSWPLAVSNNVKSASYIYMHRSIHSNETWYSSDLYSKDGGSICLWYLYVFYMHWYFLIFSYKLTVSNGLSLVTLNREEFTQWSGSFTWGVHLPLVSTCLYMHWYFLIYFLLVDCFKWALIGHIEQQRVHFVLCQFWMGGPSDLHIWLGQYSLSLSIYIYRSAIPLHVAVKLILFTIGLLILLCKDNVQPLIQYDMGGG